MTVAASSPPGDAGEREGAARRFLAHAGWGDAVMRPLAADASFRRYFRLHRAGQTAVLMDAPPPKEDVRPFLAVARHLAALGYSAPGILAEDTALGFLLIEDLGDATYTRLIAGGAAEAPLYLLAVDLLIDLHRRPDAARIALPAYDAARLDAETLVPIDWTYPAVAGAALPEAARAEYRALWHAVYPLALHGRPTLVLRDFHVDNLMLVAGRDGLAACGLLDFQDALIGPAAYDLVSLLEDARRDVAPALKAEMIDRYLDAVPGLDRAAFLTAFAVLGAQRNAKIVGIFTRLAARDGKFGYLRHLARTWRLLEGDLAHPALEGLRAWFDRYFPRESRGIPPSLDSS